MTDSAQSQKVIILGAGATRGASFINKQLPPLLINEFASLFDSSYISINSSQDGHKVKKAYKDMLDITCTNNDIEKLYTILFALYRLNMCLIPDRLVMNNTDIKLMLDNSILLKGALKNSGDLEAAIKVLKYYSKNEDMIMLTNPFNLMILIRQALSDYLHNSITDYYCVYHAKLLKVLGSEDVVVSFNYDQLADVTLFKMNKLSNGSFQGLGFSKIILPETTAKDCDGIRFIKVHGSLNWWSDIEPFHQRVYYNLLLQGGKKMPNGNIPFPIILPIHHKRFLYEYYPIYKIHIEAFLQAIRDADEICLVGKNFRNSDVELNDLIGKATNKKRRLLSIIDKNVPDKDFVDYHATLFNAKYNLGWKTLEDLYNES